MMLMKLKNDSALNVKFPQKDTRLDTSGGWIQNMVNALQAQTCPSQVLNFYYLTARVYCNKITNSFLGNQQFQGTVDWLVNRKPTGSARILFYPPLAVVRGTTLPLSGHRTESEESLFSWNLCSSSVEFNCIIKHKLLVLIFVKELSRVWWHLVGFRVNFLSLYSYWF